MARSGIEGAGAPEPEVRAAGGVVVRRDGATARVAVVHRPRYDDWSLPKGKLEPGESFDAAALREVEEETGLRCELVRELEPTLYADHKGRSKIVRWWEMTVLGGEFAPNDEVDELVWMEIGEAVGRLDHETDRGLLAAIAA